MYKHTCTFGHSKKELRKRTQQKQEQKSKLSTKERITFRKPFRNVIQTPSWFHPLWMQSSSKSGFWNAQKGAFWIVIRVESLILRTWMQSSFGTWFVRVHFENARWSHAWVNPRSRNKILPRSAQIPFVIGTAFATHVNACMCTCSSNYKSN